MVGPGDVVVYTGYRRSPIEYYLRPDGLPGRSLVLPRSLEEWPAGVPYGRYRNDPGRLEREAASVAAAAGKARGEGGRWRSWSR